MSRTQIISELLQSELFWALSDEVQGALVGALLGGLIAILGALAVAGLQYKWAREQAVFEDLLERKREADREVREFRWNLQRIAAERANRPILLLTIDHRNPDCVYAHEYEMQESVSRFVVSARRVKKADWYLSVLVENRGPVTATNCKGALEKIERWDNGKWIGQPIHGPLELQWAYAPPAVDLASGSTKALNVAVASNLDRPLTVTLKEGSSQLVEAAVVGRGTLRFVVVVNADNADPQRACLGVTWGKDWPGYWDEESFFDATLGMSST